MGFFVLCIILTFASTHGKTTDSNKPSDVFRKFHTGVVSVIADEMEMGTGFVIEFPNTYKFVNKPKERGNKFVITAAHVVKGARNISLNLYTDTKDSNGNWKVKKCLADIQGLDVVRDVALLSIACDKCDCANLAFLSTRLSNVNTGEKVLVIGDSFMRRHHSLMEGMLSVTNVSKSTAPVHYKHVNDDAVDVAFKARFHGLIGLVSNGDSGSAVMDQYGHVIAMISFGQGHLVYCITVEEVLAACVQILESLPPQFVICTAHESVFLGRNYWGGRSGKSIQEMNALGAAMDAQYIAVAHNGDEAHAFTFHLLLWTIFPVDVELEEESQCICNLSSFKDGELLGKRKDNKVMCGCFDNACLNNPLYKKRFGEDNDRRWAIYKRMSTRAEKKKWFVPENKALASMKNIADELHYWKKKTRKCLTEKRELKSRNDVFVTDEKQEPRFGLSVAVALVVVVLPTFYVFIRWRSAESKLKKATSDVERLNEELSQRDMVPDIDNSNVSDQE